jgi:hypothetical protein
MMDETLLYGTLVVAFLVSLWRVAWLGLLVPTWRIVWKLAAMVAGAVVMNRLDAEFEAGAYQPEERR